MKRMDKETVEMIAGARDGVKDLITVAEYWYKAYNTKEWQDSDAGTRYRNWIMELKSFYEVLGCVPEAPGA